MDIPLNWASAEHAWQAGTLVGALHRHGVKVVAHQDRDGNYLNQMTVKMNIPDQPEAQEWVIRLEP